MAPIKEPAKAPSALAAKSWPVQLRPIADWVSSMTAERPIAALATAKGRRVAHVHDTASTTYRTTLGWVSEPKP